MEPDSHMGWVFRESSATSETSKLMLCSEQDIRTMVVISRLTSLRRHSAETDDLILLLLHMNPTCAQSLNAPIPVTGLQDLDTKIDSRSIHGDGTHPMLLRLLACSPG